MQVCEGANHTLVSVQTKSNADFIERRGVPYYIQSGVEVYPNG